MDLTELATYIGAWRRRKGFHTPTTISSGKPQAALNVCDELSTLISRSTMDNEDKIKVHKLVDTLLDHVASDADLMLGKLMLEVTEIAEAAEAVRKGDLVNFKEERADSLIRHLDINDAVGVPTYDEVMRKMAVNEGRPHKHGKQTSI